MPTRRLFVLSCARVAAVAAAVGGFAAAPSAFAVGSLVDVQLVDRGQSEVLPVYPYRGASWVAGRPGSRYAVRLSNRSGNRVLVVLSVDGVNAVSGETAAVGQTGYVLAPYQTSEITGWRKSLTEAAAFYFTALPDSYAARTDRPDNVGVIGVAVFREKPSEPVIAPPRPFGMAAEPEAAPRSSGMADSGAAQESARDRASSNAMPAPSAAPAAKSEQRAAREDRLGTGHGEREYAPTSQVAFERASDRPTEVIRLRYDSYQNLVASGVVPGRRVAPMPDPFPAFVPDPKS